MTRSPRARPPQEGLIVFEGGVRSVRLETLNEGDFILDLGTADQDGNGFEWVDTIRMSLVHLEETASIWRLLRYRYSSWIDPVYDLYIGPDESPYGFSTPEPRIDISEVEKRIENLRQLGLEQYPYFKHCFDADDDSYLEHWSHELNIGWFLGEDEIFQALMWIYVLTGSPASPLADNEEVPKGFLSLQFGRASQLAPLNFPEWWVATG